MGCSREPNTEAVRTKQGPLRPHASWGARGPPEAQGGEGGGTVPGGGGQLGPMFSGRERSWQETPGDSRRLLPKTPGAPQPACLSLGGALATLMVNVHPPIRERRGVLRTESCPVGLPVSALDVDGTRGHASTRSRLPGRGASLSGPPGAARATQLGEPCCLNGTKTKGGCEHLRP